MRSVRLENLNKVFEGQIEAVCNVNLEVKAGETMVLAGPSGVGKTTITTLLGYYLAHKGNKVLMFDIDPQCSLSLAIGFEPEAVTKTDFTIYHLVTPNKWHNIKAVKFRQYVDSIPDIYAPNKLKKIAYKLGANAIIGAQNTIVNQGKTNVYYGTAVIVEDED